MDKSLTPAQARKRLSAIANNGHLTKKQLSLVEAKRKLCMIDDILKLPPIASCVDRGDLKSLSIYMTGWILSDKGMLTLVPSFTDILYLILSKKNS